MDDLAALLALGAAAAAGLRLLLIPRQQPPCRPVIIGDAEFQRDYEEALQLVERSPNAQQLVDSAREIRAGSSIGLAHAGSDGVVTIDTSKMPRDRRERAAVLRHEFTHTLHRDAASTPETEARAMAEENVIRRQLGLQTVNEKDFSRWEALGFCTTGTRVERMTQVDTSPREIPAQQEEAQSTPKWIQDWCTPTPREIRRRGGNGQ